MDGSERSLACMDKALQMLQTPGLEATILVVRQAGFEHAPEDLIKQFEDDEEDEIFPTEASTLQVLRMASKRCRKHGVQIKFKTVKGNVTKEIIKETASHDLIVMHGAAGRWGGLASRTGKILRKSKCSVLLVDV